MEGSLVFVGFANYSDLLDESHFIGSAFRRVLSNTVVYIPAFLAVSLPVAILFALMVQKKSRLSRIAQFAFFYPSFLPLIGAASIWAFLYTPNSGLFNTVLKGWGLQPILWLGDPNIALWSIVLFMIWAKSGWFMIYYIAGLQGMPRDVHEAAIVEGATRLQRFFHVTMPLLTRTHQFVLTIGLVGAVRWVDQLAALGEGAPNDHSNLLLYFILQYLPQQRNWGHVNAMSVILIAIVLFFTLIIYAFFERKYR